MQLLNTPPSPGASHRWQVPEAFVSLPEFWKNVHLRSIQRPCKGSGMCAPQYRLQLTAGVDSLQGI